MMDGLTYIAKNTGETADVLNGKNGFLKTTLEKILTILDSNAKSNTINEDAKAPTAEDDVSKRKKLNSSLKTGAKNVSDMKSDISDRIGAVVIVSTLNDGFKKTIR